MILKLVKYHVINSRTMHSVPSGSYCGYDGNRASKDTIGFWKAANIILVNQGLASVSFFGVNLTLVMLLTRVLDQDSATAANTVTNWIGTSYLFSFVGAFMSDSYFGRYLTCIIFQLTFVLPVGCGDLESPCVQPSSVGVATFYLSMYLVALGYGGYQPTIATFGADQFNELDPEEKDSKDVFFIVPKRSFFNCALNFGCLLSGTVIVFLMDTGHWTFGFMISMGSAIIGTILFWLGKHRYRYFLPSGNPLTRIAQVFVASLRKWTIDLPSNGDGLYEMEGESAIKGSRKILHSNEFGFLDRAATVNERDNLCGQNSINPWRLCTVTQVEEVKCLLKMLPIWLCTIIYSVIYTQTDTLFVEQGEVMSTRTPFFHLKLPAASMSVFNIISVLIFTFVYGRCVPFIARFTRNPDGLTELQRIVGASEVFMHVGLLDFFNSQAPDGIKSLGSSLFTSSISLGNFLSSFLVRMVMIITTGKGSSGWIPVDLNKGHLERFYFLIVVLTAIDFVIYICRN
ncbi:hypothetical protein MKW98_023713 [Papaver atlanticum]|uniref:NPF family transporter n=1 Tax=Papaver atlanticum TaxID=357466 RepID=A0AAD4SZB2_9MAGN|nr:hypothetical protein MKW98_023713 [Papaver atlanticum]